MWRSIRLAEKLTRSQQLEVANKHWEQYGDTTEHVLDLPQEDPEEPKYSLRRLVNRPDYKLEGQLQDNCIGHDMSWNKAADVFSVRDEDNLPVVSMRMRKRTNDDWSNYSDLSRTVDTPLAPEHVAFHNTGNDVLVVDEAVQKGNAEIGKYLRPAMHAMVQYARQNNIPTIAFANGTNRISERHSLVPTDEVERVLNEKEETPDYLYVSYLKGLRKPDGTLPLKTSIIGGDNNMAKMLIHETPTHPSMSQQLDIYTGETTPLVSMTYGDFYETARIPFSSKRFERRGGFSARANLMFNPHRTDNEEVGWVIRDHNDEFKRSLLNDIVSKGSDDVKPEVFRDIIIRPGYASLTSNTSAGYLQQRNERTEETSLKQEFVHPTTVPTLTRTYDRFRDPDTGMFTYGYRSQIVQRPVVYGREFGTEHFDYNYKTPLHIATPSSLRDQPLLFGEEGVHVAALYDENRRGSKDSHRSNFVGSQKNDIWQIDTTKLPAGVLTNIRGDRTVSFANDAVIPYEALSLTSQSEMNKRKPLPALGKKCVTCNSDWSDEHNGHDSKIVNRSHRTLPDPQSFEASLSSLSLTADEVKSLNEGNVPDSMRRFGRLRNNLMPENMRPYCDVQPGEDNVVRNGTEEDSASRLHLSIPFKPEHFTDVTTNRLYFGGNYSDYASGRQFPKQKTYAWKDQDNETLVPLEVHGWKPVEVPEKFYFAIPPHRRRDPAVYGENGISIENLNGWSSERASQENSEQDLWSVDVTHPSLRDSTAATFNPYRNTWSLNTEIQHLPYSALRLERRADDAISPHIRQFFSKVAQYLTDGETSGGWVSEYWGQGGSVSAPTTADPNEAIDPETGRRKRPNGSLWTQIGDNGIDEPAYIQQLIKDPDFSNIVMNWQGLFKNVFSPNRPGINSYSSVNYSVPLGVRQMRGWRNR